MSVVACYDRGAKILDKGQSVILLLIRLYIGYQCAISGYGHFRNFNAMVDNFIGWHIPFPTLSVAISASVELVGGVLLLVGFAARLISIPLLFNFLVAIVATDMSNQYARVKLLHFWNNADLIITDTAFPFFVTAVLILFFGPGWFSIDGIIKRIKGH